MRKFFLIVILFISFSSYGQTPQMYLIPQKASAGGGPLTFISETETAWNSTTSPKTTASISVNNGDILIAYSVDEAYNASLSPNAPTVSGGSLTWNLAQQVQVSDYTQVLIWYATATSTTSFTVSFSHTAGGYATYFGGDVLVFRNSVGGVGASNKTNNGSGAPSLSLTTTAANSMIVCVVGDYAAVNGTTRTWRTVNSITPTSGNGLETSYFRDSGRYTLYAAYYTDAGATGAKTLGLSAPSGQKYSIVGIEIKP